MIYIVTGLYFATFPLAYFTIQYFSEFENMAPNDRGDFTEVRRRRTPGNKKTVYNGQSRKMNSTQRIGSSLQRRTLASPEASAAAAGQKVQVRQGQNSLRLRSTSSPSDGPINDPKDMDESVIGNPRVDLGQEGLSTGLVLEMLILEALVNHPEMALFTSHGGLNQLGFTHPDGDLFTWLNITRQWVAQLQMGTVKSWYKENHIQESTLRYVERYVEARRKFLSNKIGRHISLAFGKDSQISGELILNVVLNKFNDNICVYHGHPSLGYKVLSTGETVFIHPSSSVSFLTKYPAYILFVDVPSSKSNQVRAVTVVNDGLAMSLLDSNSVSYDINEVVKQNVVKPCRFNNIGESVAIELEKTWSENNTSHESLRETLTYQCNNAPILFERHSKSNTVIVYSYPEYHQKIKRMVENEVQRIQNKFKDECFEIGFPDDKSHLHFLMGPRGVSEKFLFTHDFRSVWIHETMEGALSKEFVMVEMQKYGPVVDIFIFDKSTKDDSGIWGLVTFRDPDDVVKLLASSKSQEAAMLIELAPNTCNNLQQATPIVSVDRTVKIQIKLCRRPAKSGLAFVTIKGKREFGILLNTKSLTIGKNRVTISA